MKNDMTQGNEWKQILFFSLPVMAGFLLQQLYNTVDGIVVGNYVGEVALAAVGTCMPPTLVFLSLAIGLGNGSGIMISQLYGAKQMSELKKAVSTALTLLVALGVVLSILGIFISRWVLSSILTLSDGELLDQAALYFSIYCVGLVFQFTYNSISSILRAVGDSKPTLYFLCVSSGMNIGLDLLFVAVFNWGVVGAAVATVISQIVCMAVSIVYMYRKYEMFRFKRGEFTFDKQKCVVILKLGIPTTIQQCVVSMSGVALQRVINHFGQAFIAACTIGMRVENYVMVPAFGIQIGMSTFAGQNMGAGNIERIKSGRRKASIIAVAICLTLGLLVYFLATPVATLFGVSGESLAISVEYIRFLSLFIVIFAYYMTFAATLQGTGDVLYSTTCTLIGLVIRITCVYVAVFALDMSSSAVWRAMPIGWSICLIMAIARYWSGKWKTKGIIKKETVQ